MLLSRDARAQSNPARREPVAPIATAATERFRVGANAEMAAYTDTNGVTVLSPSTAAKLSSTDEAWAARGSYLVDVVSAASVDIVSSASSRWREVRQQGSLGAERQLSRQSRLGADFVVSREPDYVSLAGGALLRWEPSNKQLNPTFGYSFTHDTAGRTGTPFAVYSKKLSIHAVNLGLEAVLDPTTLAFFEVDALLEQGDSAKPYRFLPLFSAEVAPRIQPGAALSLVNQLRLPGRIEERVPGQRLRFAATSRFSRRFRTSTLIATERLYVDDWGLTASTSDLRYVRELVPRLAGILSTRWHVQSEVYFWNRAYTSSLSDGGLTVPRYRTGDRELSPLWVATLGLGLRYGLGSPASPNRTTIALQLDESATRFLDTLYLEGRWAHLVVLQLESEL
ncbi:MAG TPA: DUF3570 domain-containing protein [Polyangiaceae bacterium]|nr:DUF3570 domain-containing protein [Polyangiaceae bacterium]